jgi:transposase
MAALANRPDLLCDPLPHFPSPILSTAPNGTSCWKRSGSTKCKAGAQPVIPSKTSRNLVIPHDAVAYTLRNRIERFFSKLKHFRHIATRYDRRAIHFLACLHLASAMIWMR